MHTEQHKVPEQASEKTTADFLILPAAWPCSHGCSEVQKGHLKISRFARLCKNAARKFKEKLL
jgi:hypothetical protein